MQDLLNSQNIRNIHMVISSYIKTLSLKMEDCGLNLDTPRQITMLLDSVLPKIEDTINCLEEQVEDAKRVSSRNFETLQSLHKQIKELVDENLALSAHFEPSTKMHKENEPSNHWALEEFRKTSMAKEARSISVYNGDLFKFQNNIGTIKSAISRILSDANIVHEFVSWLRTKGKTLPLIEEFRGDTRITPKQVLEIATLYYHEYKVEAIKMYWHIRRKSNSKNTDLRYCKAQVDKLGKAFNDVIYYAEFSCEDGLVKAFANLENNGH